MISEAQLLDTLQSRFKLASFRPGQQEAIITLLEQGRLLCIQPTGHGKSLLYQLPATLFDGITLVISPLLALMRDQIQQLQQRFDIAAASINSDQDEEENSRICQLARQGQFKILFVAPEKLDHTDYFNFLLELPISFVVVDEAHCISTWGHDFRPSYRQIIHFIHAIEHKNTELKVLGITATANQKTEHDIAAQLSTTDKPLQIHRHSMNRANIQLTVLDTFGLKEKLLAVRSLLKKLNGAGLIYCATRDNTELVAEYLQTQGIAVAAYHAGFNSNAKIALQNDFIANRYQAIVATNALGMGIDKQDLRYIIHFDMPGSITAYYQEVGRCGRDGQLAQGVLLFNEADKKIHQHFINSAQPSREDFEKVFLIIKQAESPPQLMTIKNLSGLHPTRVLVILSELIEQGYVVKTSVSRKQVYQATSKKGKLSLTRYETQLMLRTRELTDMINYGKQINDCLMVTLRKALGDVETSTCGHCSRCKPSALFLQYENADVDHVGHWLNQRTCSINLGRTTNIHPGIALLDGRLRSPLFIEFMKARATNTLLSSELMELIQTQLHSIKQQHSLCAVICLPSRTWQARKEITTFIANTLNIPLYLDDLQWREEPAERQGNLLNNDQRHANVDNKMFLQQKMTIPNGTILLLDDYIGCGATMKEAARVLQKIAHLPNDILPFTIASVKWHLGQRGMV